MISYNTPTSAALCTVCGTVGVWLVSFVSGLPEPGGFLHAATALGRILLACLCMRVLLYAGGRLCYEVFRLSLNVGADQGQHPKEHPDIPINVPEDISKANKSYKGDMGEVNSRLQSCLNLYAYHTVWTFVRDPPGVCLSSNVIA